MGEENTVKISLDYWQQKVVVDEVQTTSIHVERLLLPVYFSNRFSWEPCWRRSGCWLHIFEPSFMYTPQQRSLIEIASNWNWFYTLNDNNVKEEPWRRSSHSETFVDCLSKIERDKVYLIGSAETWRRSLPVCRGDCRGKKRISLMCVVVSLCETI